MRRYIYNDEPRDAWGNGIGKCVVIGFITLWSATMGYLSMDNPNEARKEMGESMERAAFGEIINEKDIKNKKDLEGLSNELYSLGLEKKGDREREN